MSKRLIPDPNAPLSPEVMALLQDQLGFCRAALALFADGSDAQRRHPTAAAEVRRGLHALERGARHYMEAVAGGAAGENGDGRPPKGRGRA